MAKDPAFLFYPNDWLGGTRHLSFEAKGAYMELLILQFNMGPFTMDDAKHVLGSNWDNLWVSLKRKFSTDGDEVFWNVRLKAEMDKRNKHSEHQRLNGIKGGRPKANKNPIETQTITQTEPKQKPLENGNENTVVRNEGILCPEMVKIFKETYPKYPSDQEADYPACLQIAYKIGKSKDWKKDDVVNGKMPDVLKIWRFMVEFSATDDWFRTRAISDFSKEYQRLVQKITSKKPEKREIKPQADAPPLKRIG